MHGLLAAGMFLAPVAKQEVESISKLPSKILQLVLTMLFANNQGSYQTNWIIKFRLLPSQPGTPQLQISTQMPSKWRNC